MFSWLSRCWGGMGVTTNFERARLQCTYADWSVPDPQSLIILMKTFEGEQTQTLPQAAINSFLSHLQQDDERVNGAFLLKNLLILDFVVEERLFLTKIGNYYNSQLLYQSGQGRQMSSSIKDLIASYYIYIKQKAKLYSQQAVEMGNKNTRKQYIKNAQVSKILHQIDICFKIQTYILDVSDKFNRGNKSPQLIQTIFSNLLKTYLFCYSIISLSIKAFIIRIPELNYRDLEYLDKLTQYINKEYTRNFLLFIERNKMIDSFKQIKYNELIIVDDKVSTIIKEQLMHLKNMEALQKTDIEIPKQIQTIDIGNLSIGLLVNKKFKQENMETEEAENELTQSKRKNFLVQLRQSGQGDEHYFTDYQNFYNQNFIISEEEQENQLSRMSHAELFKDRNFGSAIKNCPYKDMMKKSLKEYKGLQDRKFDRKNWQNWQNIYSQ